MLWGDLYLFLYSINTLQFVTATHNNLQTMHGFTFYKFLITLENINVTQY